MPEERGGLSGSSDSPAPGWLNQLPAAAVVLSREGRVRAWNVDAAGLMGWQAQSRVPQLGSVRSRWLTRLFAEVEAKGSGRVLITHRGENRQALELRARRHGADDLLVLLRNCAPQLRSRRARNVQEQRLRQFLDRLPEAALIEQQGRVVYANDAAARLLGYSTDDLTGVEAAQLLGPGTLRRIEGLLADQEGASAPIDVDAIRWGGGHISVQIAALPLQYRKQPAVQLLLRDLTAQRQAEAGLRATHERLRLISETVRDHAILTIDNDGRIASWNASAERLTGYSADDMIRAPFAVLHAGTPAEVARLFDRSLARGGRVEGDAQLRRKDGSTFHAQITVTSLSDTTEQLMGYSVVVRDLSERLHAEESLRRSEEQLRHSQKMDAVGRLAAGIAHDFNNILTAIQGHVQFLLEDLPPDLACRDDAAEIKKAAERATELTRQLLTFARKQPTRPALLNVNEVLSDVEKLLRRLLRADIALDTAYDDVPHVFADPGQIEQVLVNLVVNARDAMPGGGRITVSTAKISLDEMYSARGLSLAPGEYVQISVSDNGVGMTPETQRQIFEPFFTTKVEGTGLGLSTVYGIVKQAGGHISVYSEEGLGTTFKVFLPAQPGALPQGSGDSAAQSEGRVLLVEDDEAVRALARRALVSGGFAVTEAANGEEALRIAAEHPGSIDVVVTDLTMPRVSGEELVARMRELQPNAGIVLMSGFSEMSLMRDGRISEQQRFLEKPFTPAALTQAVREAMRSVSGQAG